MRPITHLKPQKLGNTIPPPSNKLPNTEYFDKYTMNTSPISLTVKVARDHQYFSLHKV
jgi:hypothetical protein